MPGLLRPLEKVSRVRHLSLFERAPAAYVSGANFIFDVARDEEAAPQAELLAVEPEAQVELAAVGVSRAAVLQPLQEVGQVEAQVDALRRELLLHPARNIEHRAPGRPLVIGDRG